MASKQDCSRKSTSGSKNSSHRKTPTSRKSDRISLNVNNENANSVNVVSDAAGPSGVNQGPSGESAGCSVVKNHQIDSGEVSEKGDVIKDKTLITNSVGNDYGSSFSDTTSSGKFTLFYSAGTTVLNSRIVFVYSRFYQGMSRIRNHHKSLCRFRQLFRQLRLRYYYPYAVLCWTSCTNVVVGRY